MVKPQPRMDYFEQPGPPGSSGHRRWSGPSVQPYTTQLVMHSKKKKQKKNYKAAKDISYIKFTIGALLEKKVHQKIFLCNSILMTMLNCVTPDVLWPPVVDDGDDVPTAPHDPLYLLHREVSHVPVIDEEETMTNLGERG